MIEALMPSLLRPVHRITAVGDQIRLVEAAGVAVGVSGDPDEHADVVTKSTMAALTANFTITGCHFLYMLASRRSTRSSTFANGSLH